LPPAFRPPHITERHYNMTTNKIRKAAAKPATVFTVAIAGFTVEQQANFRTAVASALVAGRKQREADEAKGNAIDKLIAALACPALLAHRFEFQARDRKGNVIETKHASLYDYARKAAPFYVGGKQQPLRLTGFKAAVLAYAGITDATSAAAEKAWSNIKGHALPAAIALADNTIAASMVDGKLTLSGGNGTAVAKGLLDVAKQSTSALVSKVKAKGTNGGKSKTPAKTPAKAELVSASATDVLRAATAYIKKVAAGEEAITNQRIAFVKALARDCAAIIAAEAAAAAKA
jgi:hypothetical protein